MTLPGGRGLLGQEHTSSCLKLGSGIAREAPVTLTVTPGQRAPSNSWWNASGRLDLVEGRGRPAAAPEGGERRPSLDGLWRALDKVQS